jgi:hypothetical protein
MTMHKSGLKVAVALAGLLALCAGTMAPALAQEQAGEAPVAEEAVAPEPLS